MVGILRFKPTQMITTILMNLGCKFYLWNKPKNKISECLDAQHKFPQQHFRKFQHHFVVLLAVSLLPLTNMVLAQGSGKPPAEQATPALENTSDTPERFTMNMREADIRAYIQWVADRTQKNIIVHRNVRGTVTVISSQPVTPDEAYELFLTVLQLNGFSAIESNGALKVIPEADAKTSNLPFLGEETRKGDTVITIIHIKNTDASQIMGSLRPLMPASAHLAAYTETNALIISDSAINIEKIMRLIKILDKKTDEIELEIIPIIHASADDISSTLSTVVKALSGSPTGANAQQDAVQFAVDKRSNSILITGTKKKRKQVRDIIAKLDAPLDGDGNTQVIYLNYIEASEITPILKSVGDSVLKGNKTDAITSFSIESSEATNALVISAPPALTNTFRSVIKQLDIQRAQVLIEAVVVQITGNAGDDFGVVYGGSEVFEDDPDGGVFGVNTPAANAPLTNLLAAANSIATADDTTDNAATLASGIIGNSGLTYGYIENGNLVAALRAVTIRNKTNIMSTPTIVALDNEEASLLVGQNVPFITGSSTSAGSTTSNPFQTIQREDIGITLNVTPRINQGDSITLEIEQTTENVSSSAISDAADLITEKTEIKTSALIKDGQILVLGGLIREDEVKNRTQVPILGNIPILGRLFRSSSVSKTRNNLMVFIRPIILKDQMQINGLTKQRYNFMRDKQLDKALSQFIKYSDHPVLEEFETFSPTNTEILPSQAAADKNTATDSSNLSSLVEKGLSQ